MRLSGKGCRAGLVALAISIGASPAAHAAAWTRIGPDGGDVVALAGLPSRPGTAIYAGLRAGGVFRSTDQGGTWSFAGAGLGRLRVAGLAVDAVRPAKVFAATDHGLFATSDGGGAWSQVRLDISEGDAGVAVAADPRRSGTAYLLLRSGGFLATTDGGATWAPRGGLPDLATVLAIDPLHPATLYAGTVSGLFKSTDAGGHWRALRGLPTVSPFIAAFALDPRNPQTLFAALSAGGVLRSTDGGLHWTRGAGLSPETVVQALAVDPTSSSVVLAATRGEGVFRSLDGGRTWRQSAAGLPSAEAQVLFAMPATVFVGTQEGVSTSRDRARSWQTGRGLAGTSIISLAIDGQAPPRLYALDPHLLFKSASRGASWLRLAVPAAAPEYGNTGPVVVDPNVPNRVLVGSLGAVLRSDAGGRRWSSLFGLACVAPDRIAIDPTDSELVYASGAFFTTGCAFQPGACGGYKFDHGQVTCLRDQHIGVAGLLGVPVAAIDPFAHDRLVTGAQSGIYQSLDAGASWSLLSSAVQSYLIVFDPVHRGTLYAAVFPSGLARSTDGGVTWHAAGTGLPAGASITSLILDPALPSTLYAATQTAVFGSTDAGDTWTELGTGLGEVTLTPRGLALDPRDPLLLYTATAGGGVMALRLDE